MDVDPSELGRNYPNAIGLLGDPKQAVRMLVDAVQDRSKHNRWASQAQRWATAWREEFEPLMNSGAMPIRPERLCRDIGTVLPADGILVSDTGYSAFWTGVMVDLKHPGQSYLRAAGSLGWAFPASLGAKCAAPGRPVICLTGDGGFWYHIGELETARRWGVNVVVVINNNSGFGQCKVAVDDVYGERAGEREHLYRFRATDFARMAREFGCVGIRVQRPGDIVDAVSEALASDLPAVVDVVTDIECAPPAPWSVGQ